MAGFGGAKLGHRGVQEKISGGFLVLAGLLLILAGSYEMVMPEALDALFPSPPDLR